MESPRSGGSAWRNSSLICAGRTTGQWAGLRVTPQDGEAFDIERDIPDVQHEILRVVGLDPDVHFVNPFPPLRLNPQSHFLDALPGIVVYRPMQVAGVGTLHLHPDIGHIPGATANQGGDWIVD